MHVQGWRRPGTSAELWAGLQLQYDLYQASKVKPPKIERIAAGCCGLKSLVSRCGSLLPPLYSFDNFMSAAAPR
jgi:hypothetical protein